MPRGSDNYVNIIKKFQEKQPSIIEKMKTKSAKAEKKKNAQNEKKRKKSNDIRKKDLITGNLPEKAIREVCRPEKQLERN